MKVYTRSVHFGLLLCLVLMLFCVSVSGCAETWKCRIDNTLNEEGWSYCVRCGGEKRTVVDSAADIPVYKSARELFDNQPRLMTAAFESAAIRFQFDKTIPGGSSVTLSYYDTSGNSVDSETILSNDTSQLILPIGKDCNRDEFILVRIVRTDRNIAVLSMTSGEMPVTYADWSYYKSKNDKVFTIYPHGQMMGSLWDNVSGVYDVLFDKNIDISAVLCYSDPMKNTTVTVQTDENGKVFYVTEYDSANRREYKSYASWDGADLSAYQRYANEHMPSWKNGGRLVPRY